MSLLSAAYEDFIIMDKMTTQDAYGSVVTEWADGAKIKAAAVKDESMQARIGEKQGVTSLYTIITPRSIILDFHDVVRRVKDGQYFRVTSNGTDKATPKIATLDMRQVTAEEWKLA